MNRRSFLKSATATGLAVGLLKAGASASMPEHNWDKYDWGPGPAVPDRLYQGPFPQYGPCAVVPDSDVSMITSPSREIVANYGMGLVAYLSDDTGPLVVPGESQEKTLEDLVKLPFVQSCISVPTGARSRSSPAGSTSRSGGRLRSIWVGATTSPSDSGSNWKTPMFPSRECRTFSSTRFPT